MDGEGGGGAEIGRVYENWLVWEAVVFISVYLVWCGFV